MQMMVKLLLPTVKYEMAKHIKERLTDIIFVTYLDSKLHMPLWDATHMLGRLLEEDVKDETI